MPVKSASRGIAVAMQSGATTGNGTVIAVPSSFNQHSFYIKGIDIPSAGAVQLESADSSDYTGTWAPLAGGPVTVPDGEVLVQLVGVLMFIRARISTDITSGTVNVNYVGAP